MTDLLVRPSASDGQVLNVTPESAGWRYVGFEVLALRDGATAERDTGDRELCVVVWRAPPMSAPHTASGAIWAAAPTRGPARRTPHTSRPART